jgi:hypothetical protein
VFVLGRSQIIHRLSFSHCPRKSDEARHHSILRAHPNATRKDAELVNKECVVCVSWDTSIPAAIPRTSDNETSRSNN